MGFGSFFKKLLPTVANFIPGVAGIKSLVTTGLALTGAGTVAGEVAQAIAPTQQMTVPQPMGGGLVPALQAGVQAFTGGRRPVMINPMTGRPFVKRRRPRPLLTARQMSDLLVIKTMVTQKELADIIKVAILKR